MTDSRSMRYQRLISVADGNLVTNEYSLGMSQDPLPTFVWSNRGHTHMTVLSRDNARLPDWAEYAINGMPVLVQNGEIVEWDEPTLQAVSGDDEVSRSGLCVTDKGDFKLFTRTSSTIAEMAESALSLGCLHAINLDGGPSTALNYRGQSLTHASCAWERPVHNSIIAVPRNP